MGANPTLIDPQARFLALPHKFRAYVAGFGSGKTWAGGAGICQHVYEHPRCPIGYFAPTYPQIRDIFFPTMEEVAFDWGLRAEVQQANKEIHLYAGRWYYGTIICRSMDKPNSIIGFKIGKALVDEIDTMVETKALAAWQKIIARLRYIYDGLNGIDVTTTPEGFKFTYKQWVQATRDNPEMAGLYGMIQASTYQNEANLPPDYIPSLLATYPDQLIEAYLNGQFVNLQQGSVYKDYDRLLNASQAEVQDSETLFIGMDFNVGKMAGIVHVKRDGQPHAVDEIIDAYDTPDMIRIIKERFWQFDGDEYKRSRTIRIYPDSTGGSRDTRSAGATDISLLKAAGFSVVGPKKNPPLRDRINAMNAMICNSQGERRYFVNVDRCPTYADCLEQQPYDDKGQPDKKNDLDHAPDAGGYFIHKEYPLKRPVTNLRMGAAM